MVIRPPPIFRPEALGVLLQQRDPADLALEEDVNFLLLCFHLFFILRVPDSPFISDR